jgi:hypothetical protein
MARVEWALFAKFGFRDSDKFLCLVTIFDALAIESIPHRVPRMGMAFGVRAGADDPDSVKVRLRAKPPAGDFIEVASELNLTPGFISDGVVMFHDVPVGEYGAMPVEIYLGDDPSPSMVTNINFVKPTAKYPADKWARAETISKARH